MTKPIVAMVGRPNVGKSTLFNRLVGRPLAIVEDQPGTTRDRLYADAEWTGHDFVVVDTGGLELSTKDDLLAQVTAQASEAIAEADVIVFITDAQGGIAPGDYEIAGMLRRSDKPVILAANKADNEQLRLSAVEFYNLGLGDPLAISAMHGLGTGDLLDLIVAKFPPPREEPADENAVKIAIVGRPNVGKSSLLNALLGWERTIVSPLPGTTRDAIDTPLRVGDQEVILIDTAGIRRKGRIEPGVEKYSVLRALRAIGRADVVLLLIDASEGVTEQDAHVAGYILEELKSVVVVVNKWDLIEKDTYTMDDFTQHIRSELKFLPYVSLVFISAKTGQRVGDTLTLALQINEARHERVPTGMLNDLVRQAIAEHAPPIRWGKRLTFYYATQPEVNPPTFVFFVNDVRLVHFGYERYLENRIREHFPFPGTPLKLKFQGHKEKGER